MNRRQTQSSQISYPSGSYDESWRFTALKQVLLKRLYTEMFEQATVPFGPFVWSQHTVDGVTDLSVKVETVPAQQHWMPYE